MKIPKTRALAALGLIVCLAVPTACALQEGAFSQFSPALPVPVVVRTVALAQAVALGPRVPSGGNTGDAASDVLSDPDLLPVSDCVIVRFDSPKKDLPSGIFRNIDPRSTQWIEEERVYLTTPKGKKSWFLKIHYEVPTVDSYNGWWAKLSGSDWSKFADWRVVLRLGMGENCTTAFKFELKPLVNGRPETFPAIVNISDKQIRMSQEYGFFDVFLPIENFVGGTDLSRMHEVVLVFENSRISEEQRKGDLLLHSIRLSPKE